MSVLPFDTRPEIKPPSRAVRTFQTRAKRAASCISVLESRLAQAEHVSSVTPADFRHLCDLFGVVAEDLKVPALSLYRRIASSVCRKGIDDRTKLELTQLRELLGLPADAWQSVHFGIAESSVEEVLRAFAGTRADTGAFRERLLTVLRSFGLPDSAYNDFVLSRLVKWVAARVRSDMADGILDPREKASLDAMVDSLNIPISALPDNLMEEIGVAIDEWDVRYGLLHPIDCGVRLQDGEVPVWKGAASLAARKSVRVGTAYAGPTVRVRIMSGLHLRAGIIAHAPLTTEALVVQDEGELLFTNKRILFVGRKRTTSVELDKILDFDAYTDGIEIHRESGQHVVFQLRGEARATKHAHIILNRLLDHDESALPLPVVLPDEWRILQDVTERLAIQLSRCPASISVDLGIKEGSSHNADFSRALLHHMNFNLVASCIQAMSTITPPRALAYLAAGDVSRSALAFVEGKPQPPSLAPCLQSGELNVSRVDEVLRKQTLQSVPEAIDAIRRFVEVAKTASAASGTGNRSGLKRSVIDYVEALSETCKALGTEQTVVLDDLVNLWERPEAPD